MSEQYTSSGLHDHLLTLRANPARIQQHMLRLIERLNNDEVIIVDATNPAVFCLESAAVMSCANMTDSESKLRRLYPNMANSPEELYLHMADVDYLGIFSNPATANLTLMFDLDEIIQKAVPETSITGTKKLTIPRYTKVYVADCALSLLYPIDIRVMPHGGFNISFDTSELSPVGRVENNLLDWFIEVVDDNRYLNITAPFYQLNITRSVISLNASSGFTKEYGFSDLYYYTRAYTQNRFGEWDEIKTTMSDLVYDKDVPTIILKVLNNAVKVTVPQIYLNNGLIKDAIRIDIYTTKGTMSVNLQNYVPRSYVHDFSPLDNNLSDKFVAPLKALSSMGIYSFGSIDGGSRGMSFSEIKKNVTSRSAVSEGLPINERQLNRAVQNLGYSIVKNIDNITDRQYLATRALPRPTSGFIATNMGLNIATLDTSFSRLKELDTVTASSYRITVKPQTLYRLDNGVLSVVDSLTTKGFDLLKNNNPIELVNQLNRATYLYSPYYYVFDVRSTEILPRIYDMNSPSIRSRYFFQDNPSVGIKLSVSNYIIANNKAGDGYTLEVRLSAGEVSRELGWEYINVQLSYVGRDESSRYYIDGVLVSDMDAQGQPKDGIFIYQFNIETQYDIDSEDGLIPIPYRSPINLTHEFDVVTSIRDYLPEGEFIPSDIDNILAPSHFANYDPTSSYIGVSQSKVTIKFGDRLEMLWNKTRTVVDTRQLKRYEYDVPATYKTNVYERDATGMIKIEYNADENIIKTVKLHSAGDFIYDVNGEQIFEHKRGETITDESGEPIYEVSGDGLRRQVDLFLIDAMYNYANTNNVIEYKNHCVNLITKWVTTDMGIIANQLLDRSEVFYYPPISVGTIAVNADNDKSVKIDSRQSIKVKAYLSQLNYRNSYLRDSMSKSITVAVQEALERRTVSVDAILQRLRAVIGNNVISFEISGFADDKYRTVTMVDETVTLALGKRAIVLPNLTIDIVDDIVIEYHPHGDS